MDNPFSEPKEILTEFKDDTFVDFVEKAKKNHVELHQKLKQTNSFKLHVDAAPLISYHEDDGEMIRILLIRHAESEGNVDKSIWCTTPDYLIPLSEKGIKQAQQAGKKKLKNFMEKCIKKNWTFMKKN